MEERLPRKLAAILYGDVAGYSRLTGDDEDATHRRLRDYLDLIAKTIENHHGQVMHYAGDAVLAKFDAVVDALSSAIAIQNDLKDRNQDLPDERKVQFRVGVNLGDVIEDRGDIYGDGVNVAARLESLADAGGICISESVRTAIGKKLPYGYDFMGEQQVKNIEEPVRAYGVLLDSSKAQVTPPAKPTLELPDKPSIAVLPFTNMSSDPEQEFLADGISEDIITALSKFRWFFVTARNSTFTYKGQAIDIKRVGEEMGVRYVLEGSLRQGAGRVRVSAQLIEAASGNHIWAERYDRQIEDIFDLQDEITMTIVAAVEPELAAQERDRAVNKPTRDLKAWDLFQRGIAKLWQMERKDIEESEAYLRQALKADPNFGRPHGYLAYCQLVDVLCGWREDEQAVLRRGIAEAKAALAVDQRDSFAHFALGRLYTVGGDHQAAAQEIGEALRINPNFAYGYLGLASVYYWLGEGPAVLENADKAIRLSPNDPLMWLFLLYRAHGYEFIGDFDRAIECFEQSSRFTRVGHLPFCKLAAAYYEAGRKEEAAAAFEQARLIEPNLSLEGQRKALRFIQHNKFDYYLRNLQALGLK
ncbi:MAG: tetratricopeptide repeat protein [Proteobacteria bacterium]|nr:tetratricopeptide repeat protein [Pseudomonadota bacterium]